MPLDVFAEEIKFYELGDEALTKFREEEGFVKEEEKPLPKQEWKKKIWLLFEAPESSKWAKIIAFFSVAIVLISIVTFCLETLPKFKHYKIITPDQYDDVENDPAAIAAMSDNDVDLFANMSAVHAMPPISTSSTTTTTTPALVLDEDERTNFSNGFFIIETICIVWFCLELSVRCLACPDMKFFLLSPMNVSFVHCICEKCLF